MFIGKHFYFDIMKLNNQFDLGKRETIKGKTSSRKRFLSIFSIALSTVR